MTMLKLHIILSAISSGQCLLGSLTQAATTFLVVMVFKALFIVPPLTAFTIAMFSLALDHIDHSAILNLIIGWYFQPHLVPVQLL